jgi:hypothetical protein
VKVLLIQFDGKFPNIALMRISSHHKALGDDVTLKHAGNIAALEPLWWGHTISGYLGRNGRMPTAVPKTST